MRDLRAGVGQQRAVGVVEPDAVRQHRALVQQPGAVVDIEVAARLGEQLGHPGDLGAVLGHMRLHVEAGHLGHQPAGHRQLPGRAGRREAHRHRIGQPAALVPAADQVAAVALGARHVVAQAVGRVAVHQHLAGDQAHAAAVRAGQQRLGRADMHRREHHRAGAAVRQQRVEEQLGPGGGHRRIGVAHLGREGVGLQPVEQLGAVAGDDVELRAVHMGVDEAGHQQPAALVLDRPDRGVRREGRGRLDTGDAPGLDQQPVVGPPAHARHEAGGRVGRSPAGIGVEVEQVGAQRQAVGNSSHADGEAGTGTGTGSAAADRPGAGSRRATSRTVSRSQRSEAAPCVTSCQSW